MHRQTTTFLVGTTCRHFWTWRPDVVSPRPSSFYRFCRWHVVSAAVADNVSADMSSRSPLWTTYRPTCHLGRRGGRHVGRHVVSVTDDDRGEMTCRPQRWPRRHFEAKTAAPRCGLGDFGRQFSTPSCLDVTDTAIDEMSSRLGHHRSSVIIDDMSFRSTLRMTWRSTCCLGDVNAVAAAMSSRRGRQKVVSVHHWIWRQDPNLIKPNLN